MLAVIMRRQQLEGWFEANMRKGMRAGWEWASGGACGSTDLHVGSFVLESAPTPTHPGQSGHGSALAAKCGTAQPNRALLRNFFLFHTGINAGTLELVCMRRSGPRTETAANIWHNWVWTVSSGHERVAWGRGGERHTRVGSGWRYRGCPVAQCSLPCAASGCPHLYLARPVRCPPPAPRE